ncbi:MAG: Protein of unknown function (DUF3631) [Candidatus Nitrotoga sp. SPKER]|nr:MAG: Protein of unknown function (DUF3631) [Candidatus Nitrotoga sp. SPKER]
MISSMANLRNHHNLRQRVPPPGLTDEGKIKWLSSLKPVEYDQAREEVAKELGIRTSTLDACVKGIRASLIENKDSPFEIVEAWHEPVDLGWLLDEISESIRRHIICERQTAHAVALWVAMTHFDDVFDIAPLAIISAPEMRCGKSELKRLIGKMVLRPLDADGMSASVLFRGFDLWNPTLLVDEYDAFVKDDEDLRRIINAGHQRGGCVWRCVGDDHTPKRFNVFGPKVLAGIGGLAPTIMDRGIILQLRRKLSTETVVRQRDVPKVFFKNIQSKLARVALDYAKPVSAARPALPDSLSDRAQDNWEPLFQIAHVAGDEWLKRAREASLKLSGQDEDIKTIDVELLADIQEAFENTRVNKISFTDLIKAICDDEEAGWATYNRGKPITPRQVSKRLKEYGISSKPIRFGYDGVQKGFDIDQFGDAFARYLKNLDFPVTQLQPNKDGACNHVTGKTPILGMDEVTEGVL